MWTGVRHGRGICLRSVQDWERCQTGSDLQGKKTSSSQKGLKLLLTGFGHLDFLGLSPIGLTYWVRLLGC